MTDQTKVRIYRLEEGHRGTSAPAPAIATTTKAVSALPPATPKGSSK
jgi:hypothetical protein